MSRQARLWLTLAAAAVIVAGAACRSGDGLTRKRIKSVERGLRRAVFLNGLEPEKLPLADRMAFYRVPGVSLAVIDRGGIEWTKFYGNRDDGAASPLAPDTVFQGGAFSQMITAAAVMKLAEQGVLSLDEDVRRRLKSWIFPAEFASPSGGVTIRALLSHSAGLSDQVLLGCGLDERVPTLVEMLDGVKPARNGPLWIAPRVGTVGEPRYAEAGYVVLQLFLEDVAGKSFETLVREIVIEPLGLRDTAFESPLPEGFGDRTATGHLREGRAVAGLCQVYPQKAAAGVWTTPADFAAFLLDLLRSAASGTGTILSGASARALLSPQAGAFGYGFRIEGRGDDIRFELRAKTHGFSAAMALFPVKSSGAVLMTNSDNGPFLIDEILAALSDVYQWPAYAPEKKDVLRLAPETYQSFVGTYEVNPAYLLDVRWEDYFLVIQPTGQAATKFYAEGQSLFYSTDPYIRIQFLKGRDGRVTGLVLSQQDFELEAKKK